MLTDYDRAWLDALKQSIKNWSPLLMAELRRCAQSRCR